jgi:hypothetical protein
MGPPGLLVVEVRTHVSDVRIRQADDLTGVAGVGENFLVTGEAGVENDFAAAARDGTRRPAVKDAPVFQREDRGSVLNFGQCVLPYCSSKWACHFASGSVMESDPK